MTIEALVILGIVGALFYATWRWLSRGTLTPDPWGPEVAATLEREETASLCPHCLAPQEHDGWFCPECGATVGKYGNYLPNVYIFSIGEAVRAGVQEHIKWTPLLIIGYVFVAFGFFSILAPIYLLLLVWNHHRLAGESSGPVAAWS